ncbi:unnamed protein product, partial [Adineta steineri]
GDDILTTNNHQQQQSVVIGGNVGSLIDDSDIFGPMPTTSYNTTNTVGQQQQQPSAVPNLLDDELSSILGPDMNIGGAQTPQPQMPIMNTATTTTSLPMSQPAKGGNLLDDLFGDLNLGGGGGGLSYSSTNTYALPKEVWLSAQKGKGLEIIGTFARRNNQIVMEMDFSN